MKSENPKRFFTIVGEMACVLASIFGVSRSEFFFFLESLDAAAVEEVGADPDRFGMVAEVVVADYN